MSGKRIKKVRKMLNSVLKESGKPYTQAQKDQLWKKAKRGNLEHLTYGT